MNTAVLPHATVTSPPEAPGHELSETARHELHALRAELDVRYTALETALSSPDEYHTLESLVLDLARVATEEAEAASRRAILDAQLDALAQTTAARAAAQTTLDTQRAAGATLRTSLEQTRAALETERAAGAALLKDVERLQSTLDAERAQADEYLGNLETLQGRLDAEVGAGAEMRDALERARMALDAEQTASMALRQDLQRAQDALDAAHTSRSANQREVEETRAALEAERAATATLRRAVQEADEHAAVVESKAQAELGSLEKRYAVELEQKHAAASDVSAALAATQHDLDAARIDIEQRTADLAAAAARIDALEHQRQELEHASREADARVGDVGRDRDALAKKLESARSDAATAKAEALARFEALDKTCKKLEQAWRESEARLDAIAHERDMRTAEVESVRHTAQAELESARQAAQAELESVRQAAHKEIETIRQAAQAKLDAAKKSARAEFDAARQAAEDLKNTHQAARASETEAFAQLEQARESAERRIEVLELELQQRAAAPPVQAPVPAAVAVAKAASDEIAETPNSPTSHKGSAKPAAAEPLDPPSPDQAEPATRHAFDTDIQVQIDGGSALLVNLSTTGAQVLSPTPLKPNRAVKIVLPFEKHAVTGKGKIVWVRLEPSSTEESTLLFRAGVAFTTIDADTVTAFLKHHARRD